MVTGAADSSEHERMTKIQFAVEEKLSLEGVSIMKRTDTLIKVAALAASLFLILFAAAAATNQSPKIDASTPVEELKALASQGNADAMLELGERLIQGQGVETNAAEGLQWLHKAAAAGKSQAWYDIGFVYSNGVGVETNMTEAMRYFRKGAEAGNADCQTSMGMFYQAGERIPGGVKADPAEAVKWYRLAAEQDHGEAIFHLAGLYMAGQGVKADSSEAVKWYRRGAELGNPEAKWILGQCYQEGKGVAKDIVQACALFSAAIDGVDDPAQKQGMTEKRDKLCKELNADQLKEAERLAEEWKAKGKK
jgi:TPR repeat protein